MDNITKTATKIKRRPKKWFKRILIVLLAFVIVIALGYGGANLYTYSKEGKFIGDYRREALEIARKSKEDDFILSNPSKIYDDSGKLLTSLRSGDSGSYIKYNSIPKNVANAFIAIEDRSFWDNDGISIKGTLRAAFSLVINRGAMTQGGSTITQQLVRGIYLTRDKSIGRKIKEIFLSREISKKYSKKKILEYYVNSVYFSNNVYGINDAASTYFNTTPDKLTLSQTAYLCSIPNRPSLYNPYTNSKAVLGRRDRILDAMLDAKFITKKQCEEAKKETITLAEKTTNTVSDYATTYAIHSATIYLMKRDNFKFEYSWSNQSAYQTYKKKYNSKYNETKQTLYTKGYNIYTTLNADRQQGLQNALNTRLNSYSTRKTDSGSYLIQGSLTVVDNKTHKVVGIIGGRQTEDNSNMSLNRAYQSPRQPGSSIKPLVVYAPGIEIGANAQTYLKDVNVKQAYEAYKRNSDFDNLSGNGMQLSSAVHASRNGAALYLYNKVTPTRGLAKLQKMRFSSIVPADYVLASALGGFSYGATSYEMANAYSTIANDGQYTEADCLTSIIDKDGNEIYKAPSSSEVYEKTAAQTMTSVMQGVLTSGTARSMGWSSSLGDAAGKTGTTNANKDAWFCGFTPQYSIAVWTGTDDSKSTSLQGSSASFIWKSAMQYMLQGQSAERFNLTDVKSSSDYDNSLFPNNNRKLAVDLEAEAKKKAEQEAQEQAQQTQENEVTEE